MQPGSCIECLQVRSIVQALHHVVVVIVVAKRLFPTHYTKPDSLQLFSRSIQDKIADIGFSLNIIEGKAPPVT
jgi:hypothetical protein